jgi:hypothetical protein
MEFRSCVEKNKNSGRCNGCAGGIPDLATICHQIAKHAYRCLFFSLPPWRNFEFRSLSNLFLELSEEIKNPQYDDQEIIIDKTMKRRYETRRWLGATSSKNFQQPRAPLITNQFHWQV